MPSIHDTAYPRLKSSLSEKELNEIFTPTAEEFDLAHSVAQSIPLRIVFLVLLKTFQRLGYFLPLHKAPRQIAERISLIYGVHYEAMEWEVYDASGSRYRFIARIREHPVSSSNLFILQREIAPVLNGSRHQICGAFFEGS
jgi:hypothetical protein